MQLCELLNELLELIDICQDSQNLQTFHTKTILDQNNQMINVIFTINDYQLYGKNIGEVITLLQKETYFSKEAIDDFILKKLLLSKIENNNYTIDDIQKLTQQLDISKVISTQVITNISGITLADNQKPIQFGCFEIGYNRDIKSKIKQIEAIPTDFFHDEISLYFKVNVSHLDLHDHEETQETILLYFLDFIRLILFINGDFTNQYNIKINNKFNNLIITDFQTYCYSTLDWPQLSISRAQETTSKLHINNLNSADNHASLSGLWELYAKINQISVSITDIEKRVISASLAIGEAIRSEEKRNALIYTCIALEALFSCDQGQLFQRNIDETISNCLAFVVSPDKEGRKNIIIYTKTIYKERLALIHGRQQPSKHINVYWMSGFIRTAIGELLNNKKYKKIKTINQLYDMITDAQLSY